MNRHRKSFKAIQCPGYSHPLTKQLAGVLRQTQGERFTRFAAFRSLQERQAAENEARPDTRPCRVEVTHTALASSCDKRYALFVVFYFFFFENFFKEL